MNPYDEDDEKDDVLKALTGEVDDYAAKQLPGEAGGVTIEIHVKPHGEPDGDEGEGEKPGMEEQGEDHDPIAHILGMCCGGKSGQ